MANPEHLAILNQGVEAWNDWREQNPSTIPDFINAELNDANLRTASLHHANLLGAKLRRALLSDADFRSATLIGADLGEAVLTAANFADADLFGASLHDAGLVYANLSRATLIDANLRGANLDYSNLSDALIDSADLSTATMWFTLIANTDLSDAKGLDTIVHFGPSTIGIDTLFKSQGKIPDEFLRGAGVPEEVIEQLLPIIRSGPAIQWHSCFISYSTKDEEFARRLHARMREAGLRVWFAPEDVKGGKKLHERLFEAIQLYDKLLLVLSENSIQSEWVMTEIRKAREVEKKENRRKLFPIRLVDFDTLRDWTCFDADTGKDLAVEVREYFIPDFSNWKDHDAFEAAFTKLLKDLKADEAVPRTTRAKRDDEML